MAQNTTNMIKTHSKLRAITERLNSRFWRIEISHSTNRAPRRLDSYCPRHQSSLAAAGIPSPHFFPPCLQNLGTDSYGILLPADMPRIKSTRQITRKRKNS